MRIYGMHNTTEYCIWKAMRSRCNSPKNKDYKHYGGRGIKVCERWNSFENFLSDMGKRPLDLTIERINNDGDYEPKNCKWATRVEQMANKRYSSYLKLYEIDGFIAHLAFWARVSGVNPTTIYSRLKIGWPIKKAVFHPVKINQQRRKGRKR